MRSIASFLFAALLLAAPAAAVEVRDWTDGQALLIDFDLGRPTTVAMRQADGELYLEFSAPVGDADDLERLTASWPQALVDARAGQNSLLLRSKPGAGVTVWRTAQGARIAIEGVSAAPDPARLSPPPMADGDMAAAERRLQVLRGRVELATGRPEAAREALEAARVQNPDDPETLTALAAAESQLGRADRAIAYLDRAIAVRPDDPDLARDRARIQRDMAAFVEAHGGWRDTDDSDRQSRAGVEVSARYGQRWRLGAAGDVGHVRAKNVQRANGAVSNVRQTFGRGRLSAAYGWNADHETEGALHVADHGVGVGVAHRIGPQTAQTTLSAAYAEPYHDDIAGIADKGRRHHLRVGHDRRFDRDWRVAGAGALYQYGAKGDENVAQTGGVELSVRRRLYSTSPFYVDAGYSLDAEYQIDEDVEVRGGVLFNPLPIDNREVHFGDVSASATLSETVTASGTLGYGFDRFGGDGPTAAASLGWEPSPDWKLGVSASFSFAATRGDNDSVTNIGFYVRRRLGAPLQPSAAERTEAPQ